MKKLNFGIRSAIAAALGTFSAAAVGEPKVAKPKQPSLGRPRAPSHTKSGPGRRHVDGDGTHAHLTIKQKQAGAYGRGLRNWCNRKPSKGRV